MNIFLLSESLMLPKMVIPSGSIDKTIKIWRFSDQINSFFSVNCESECKTLSFFIENNKSKISLILASGHYDECIRLWNCGKKINILKFQAHFEKLESPPIYRIHISSVFFFYGGFIE